jgi:hypothetical protein
MTRRLAWFAAGMGVGVMVTQRVARSTGGSAAADAVSGIAARVRRVVDDVIADGRVEMQRREARLREVLAAPDHDTTGAARGRR